MTGRESRESGVREAPPERGSAGEYHDLTDPEDLRARLVARENYLEELCAEVGQLRSAVEEKRASQEAVEERVRFLEDERLMLREKIQEYEAAAHARLRRREGRDREVERLQRTLERRDEEKSRLKELLQEAEEEVRDRDREHRENLRRRDATLEEARSWKEELERGLRERETELKELETRLRRERELRRRLEEPDNRLRAGIETFNASKHRKAVAKLSGASGHPAVRAVLGEGEEPAVHLTFTWPQGDWRVYLAHPGSSVEDPRVYLLESGGGRPEPGSQEEPNARLGTGTRGRVSLGV